MAAMYGSPRLTSGSSGSCGCCGAWHGKEQVKGREERQWRRDFTDEISYREPEYPPGYDHYPEGGEAWPENLAAVERVTFFPAERID
jgi:hypothetical protein